MPWTLLSATDMRTLFIADAKRQTFSFAELCRRYQVSRKTGYKWLARYTEAGPEGLADRSHRTHTCPHRTPKRIVRAILQLRRRHPTWGAKKLIAVLQTEHPDWGLPARSTVHDLLRRHGLVPRKRRRPRFAHPGRTGTLALRPNHVWTADFKGHFRTGNGLYCYPLTLVDRFSRFLLDCRALPSTRDYGARPVFERAFRDYGLPERIRTDNGTPFATYSLGRLSTLSVWWIRLGIIPELIDPGKPQQNGAHERMHKTLKAETTRPPGFSLRSQQRRFNAFRSTFNLERPHESLGQTPPGSLYQESPRPYPHRLAPVEYPGHFELRKVSSSGGIRWRNQTFNVSTVLTDEYIGLEEIDDGLWAIYFAHVELGRLDERTGRITDQNGRLYRYLKTDNDHKKN